MKVRTSHQFAVELSAEEVLAACRLFVLDRMSREPTIPAGWRNATPESAQFVIEPGAMDGASATLFYSTPAAPTPEGEPTS